MSSFNQCAQSKNFIRPEKYYAHPFGGGIREAKGKEAMAEVGEGATGNDGRRRASSAISGFRPFPSLPAKNLLYDRIVFIIRSQTSYVAKIGA